MMRGRKGMTLVEVIAVAAITVVVLGAACAALYAGSAASAAGTAGYANHGDAKLLERMLEDSLPAASRVAVESGARTGEGVLDLYFDSDGDAVWEEDGRALLHVSGIESIRLTAAKAGADSGSHSVLSYTIVAENGGHSYSLSGGVVLGNIRDAEFDETLSPESPGSAFLVAAR